MSTPNTSTTIDATAAVPIDVASKVALGAAELRRHVLDLAHTEAVRARREWAQLRLWVERQHLQPEQVLQLVTVTLYGLVAVVELLTERRRKGR